MQTPSLLPLHTADLLNDALSAAAGAALACAYATDAMLSTLMKLETSIFENDIREPIS